MHEVQATIPSEHVSEAARLAHAVGIDHITISEVWLDGMDAPRKMVSVSTSTPKARAYLDAFLNSPVLAQTPYRLTSRELRAILDEESASDITRPMCEPFPDVIQDLWQLSHVTPSYLARATAGAMILATGVIENNAVAVVVSALFLPFLSQVLASSFGLWSGDRKLFAHGLKALLISNVLAVAAGATVAVFEKGPIAFTDFRSPLVSLAISAAIGITAGLSTADDTGRRYLIGVAASVQLAVFPVWLGAALVLGLAPAEVLHQRIASFVVSLAAISATSVAAFAALHLKHSEVWGAPRSGRRPALK